MSHYLHHIIEVKTETGWKKIRTAVKPGKYFEEEKKDKLFKIGDEEFYWEDEFVTSYLSLRDYYFGSHPWDHTITFHHVTKDVDPETQTKIQEWLDGHFILYCCTVEELNNAAEKIFEKWKDKFKHESIMNFSADFVKRLGYGKEDSEYVEDPDEREEMEDWLYCYYQFIALANSAKAIAETYENTYWVDDKDIRIIIWTD